MNITQREKRTANVIERVEKALLNAGILSEEIVNPDNRGTMTKAELIKRDRIARSPDVRAKIRAVKGNDNDENARHRYATFITIAMRGGKKGAVQPGEKRRTKKRKPKAKARTQKDVANQLRKKEKKKQKAKKAARKVVKKKTAKKKERTPEQKFKAAKKLIATLDRGRKQLRRRSR